MAGGGPILAANCGPPGPIFTPDQNFRDSSPQIQMKVVESWAGPGNEVSKTERLPLHCWGEPGNEASKTERLPLHCWGEPGNEASKTERLPLHCWGEPGNEVTMCRYCKILGIT